ncbi:hypothetical protein Tco_0370848, partial [Tanacetum coccineum]
VIFDKKKLGSFIGRFLENDLTRRKAHLLEDTQIPSVGVFDEVFSTWMAFGGNTHDLGSFGGETNEITDLHQILEEVLVTKRGDGVAGIKRRRRDPSGDGILYRVDGGDFYEICDDLRFIVMNNPFRKMFPQQKDNLYLSMDSSSWTYFKKSLSFGIDLWPQSTKILYDHVNPVTRRTIDQSAGGKLHDRNAKESWALLEDLTLYDNESWNDPKDFAKPVKEISLLKIV